MVRLVSVAYGVAASTTACGCPWISLLWASKGPAPGLLGRRHAASAPCEVLELINNSSWQAIEFAWPAQRRMPT